MLVPTLHKISSRPEFRKALWLVALLMILPVLLSLVVSDMVGGFDRHEKLDASQIGR